MGSTDGMTTGKAVVVGVLTIVGVRASSEDERMMNGRDNTTGVAVEVDGIIAGVAGMAVLAGKHALRVNQRVNNVLTRSKMLK